MSKKSMGSTCMRCGSGMFERLETYGHCLDCFQVDDPATEPAIPDWALSEYRQISKEFDLSFAQLNSY